MIHPVFRLAASQPLLLAEHAAAYAALASEALSAHSAYLKQRLAYQLAGAACLVVGVALAGVALLLWVSLPVVDIRAPWLYLVTPAVPAIVGLWALWMARERVPRDPYASLRLQLTEDAALLNVVAAR